MFSHIVHAHTPVVPISSTPKPLHMQTRGPRHHTGPLVFCPHERTTRRWVQPYEVQHVSARVLLAAPDRVGRGRRLSAGTLVKQPRPQPRLQRAESRTRGDSAELHGILSERGVSGHLRRLLHSLSYICDSNILHRCGGSVTKLIIIGGGVRDRKSLSGWGAGEWFQLAKNNKKLPCYFPDPERGGGVSAGVRVTS